MGVTEAMKALRNEFASDKDLTPEQQRTAACLLDVAEILLTNMQRMADALESMAASNKALMHHYVGADANSAKTHSGIKQETPLEALHRR